VRIDHFRGFDEYYSIPYGEGTALKGHWEKGPGMDLWRMVEQKLGWNPVIAEDLGYVTDSVRQLVKDSGFPGMKVLEFAFDARESSSYLPHTYQPHCVCYTGTHDNSPLALWREEAAREDVAFAERYLGLNEAEGFHWGVIRGGMSSVAELFVAQMQDYLGLPYRMNAPGTPFGNWEWRLLPGEVTPALAEKLREMAVMYGRAKRLPDEPVSDEVPQDEVPKEEE
jgi:4-alpha-glucanotransferase